MATAGRNPYLTASSEVVWQLTSPRVPRQAKSGKLLQGPTHGWQGQQVAAGWKVQRSASSPFGAVLRHGVRLAWQGRSWQAGRLVGRTLIVARRAGEVLALRRASE